jgi:L-asparaginase
MNQQYGNGQGALIIIHGGASPIDPKGDALTEALKSIESMASSCMSDLNQGASAIKVVVNCLEMLENDSKFNAGVGSALQSDGLPRLTSSIMDGSKQNFSGVVSVPYLTNPSKLAEKLQRRNAKVLTSPGAELLARELKLPVASNLTEKRSKKWLDNLDKGNYPPSVEHDTVGCVVIDSKGRLASGSSTGGVGNEYPGRVSDSGTVSGNYASKFAAITVTGKGEQITNDAVASKTETRIRDGMSLEDAYKKTFNEGKKRNHIYGWIGLDSNGAWGVAHLTKAMPFVVWDSNGLVEKFRT